MTPPRSRCARPLCGSDLSAPATAWFITSLLSRNAVHSRRHRTQNSATSFPTAMVGEGRRGIHENFGQPKGTVATTAVVVVCMKIKTAGFGVRWSERLGAPLTSSISPFTKWGE